MSGLSDALQGGSNAFPSPYRVRRYIGKDWRLPTYEASAPPDDQSGSKMKMRFKSLNTNDVGAEWSPYPFGGDSVILEFYKKHWDAVQRGEAPSTLEIDFAPASAGSHSDYLVAVTRQRLDAARADAQRAEEEHETALSNARKEDTHASLEQLTAQQQRDSGKTPAQRYLAFKARQREGQ